MGKKSRSVLSMFLAWVLVFTAIPYSLTNVNVKAAGYNATAAIEYAHAHAFDGQGLCAEFVSKCLTAGGLPHDSQWGPNVGVDKQTGYNNWTTTSLKDYLVNKGYQIIYNPTYSQILPGNPVFYSYNPDYATSHAPTKHAAICVANDGGNNPLIAAHNNAQDNKSHASMMNTFKGCCTVLLNGTINPNPVIPPVDDSNPGSPYPIPSGNLKMGSRGDSVKWVQRFANDVLGSGIAEDGIYGNDTEYAVRYFQQNNGLTADGICGSQTTAKMLDVWRHTVVKHEPYGYLDVAECTDNGELYVYGWALDNDDNDAQLRVHIYIGGPAGASDVEIHEVIANKYRKDVGDAIGRGAYHGFCDTISISKKGNLPIYAYAINVGAGGNNVLDACPKTVSIKTKAATTAVPSTTEKAKTTEKTTTEKTTTENTKTTTSVVPTTEKAKTTEADYPELIIDQEKTFETNNNKVYYKFHTPKRDIPSYFKLYCKNISDSSINIHIYLDTDMMINVTPYGWTNALVLSNEVEEYYYQFEPDYTYYVCIGRGTGEKPAVELKNAEKGTHRLMISELQDDYADDAEHATSINSNTEYSGKLEYIGSGDDKDFVKFTTDDSGKCSIYIAGVSTGFSYYLYDSVDCVKTVGNGWTYKGSNDTDKLELDPNHTYYIKFYNGGGGTYKFKVITPKNTTNSNKTNKDSVTEDRTTEDRTTDNSNNSSRSSYDDSDYSDYSDYSNNDNSANDSSNNNSYQYDDEDDYEYYVPSKVKGLKVSNKKSKALKVSWNYVSGADCYQVQYSTSKRFGKKKTRYTTGTGLTIKKLSRYKKYYIRVRAYSYDNYDNRVYGKWSKVKSKTVR
ncbi:MAG: peptidoglycan-binding protein [Lachnospiraceae bacterium]|nr:peptidoglycan-binding protein [Lachnospiraceae bacterium]